MNKPRKACASSIPVRPEICRAFLPFDLAMNGDAVFVADTYRFTDGLFHERNSQPHQIIDVWSNSEGSLNSNA